MPPGADIGSSVADISLGPVTRASANSFRKGTGSCSSQVDPWVPEREFQNVLVVIC
ncbi:hypothetical protein LAUMK191_04072 [Mycobacterium attenuatum]|nr:hypothetical protein LAUMK191_04072 [Mycobacterium attenuatum]